ncbi:MAG: hypothetical protein QF412_07000 [Planctomycetota bacterium]|nr:hypothetical protein [Planctomycetota bacterium]
MTHSPATIPSPPRPVRWRTVLGKRWVVGLVGAIALFTGGILLITFSTINGMPFADEALDQNSETGEARVIQIAPIEGSDTIRITYRFRTSDQREWDGQSLATSLRFHEGLAYAVEYLPDDPAINRLAGTRRSSLSISGDLLLGLLLLPGLVLLGIWFRGALRLKLLLTEGSLAKADVTSAKLLHHVNPNQVSLRYRFTDRHGTQTEGGHWLLAFSALGKRLQAGQSTVTVIHDDARPDYNRAVGPEHFVG